MADLGEALRSWALTKSEITDLCGSRWYPDVMPQGATLPAVVVEIISSDEEGSLDPNDGVGLTHARVQIDAVATRRAAANALANAIRNLLRRFRGNMGGVFVCGVSVVGGLRTDTVELGEGSDERYRLASRDYLISFDD